MALCVRLALLQARGELVHEGKCPLCCPPLRKGKDGRRGIRERRKEERKRRGGAGCQEEEGLKHSLVGRNRTAADDPGVGVDPAQYQVKHFSSDWMSALTSSLDRGLP